MKTYSERTASIVQKAEAQKAKRKRAIKLTAIISGVAAAVLAFNLVMFVPYTVGGADISAYSSSEYYGVIKELYKLTYSPRRTNNFKELGKLFAFKATAPGEAPGSFDPEDSGYSEVTLKQTDGVTEGDLFKRSGTHIFYLSAVPAQYEVITDCTTGAETVTKTREETIALRVYTVAADESKQVAEYAIDADDEMNFAGYSSERELYLSEDLSTVTVVSPCYDVGNGVLYTAAINIDVSDVADIKETGRVYVAGKYVGSRTAGGAMLMITDFAVPAEVDFGSKRLYVPHYGRRGAMTELLPEDIVCPDNANRARYTVVCTLGGDLAVKDAVALLSFSDEVYVSQNNLYVTHGYSTRVVTGNEYKLSYSYDKTDIGIVPYGADGLGEPRTVTASGSVLNRYCLDENDGMLRAVTNVRPYNTDYRYMTADGDPYAGELGNRCFLFCFDLGTLETAAKLDFAPVGESIRSARFYGDTAYVCTAEDLSFGTGANGFVDPVFAFDLSDINNITYKDTGTIPGYSLSLTRFAGDTLLGIGYGDARDTLKVELYVQTDTAVQPTAKYELEGVRFSQQFKAHMIDGKNRLIGLGVADGSAWLYKVLRYDGYDLKEVLSVDIGMPSSLDSVRATVIDGYIYILDDPSADYAPDGEAVGKNGFRVVCLK